MNALTLFSVENITWDAIKRLYGEQAVATGVREWYHPEKGWQKFPSTSAMAMIPEHQVMLLAERGATTVQLYVDISREETRTPDFLISELYTPPPCSTSSTSPKKSEAKNTAHSTTSGSSKATSKPSKPASKNTGQGGAQKSSITATSDKSTTT